MAYIWVLQSAPMIDKLNIIKQRYDEVSDLIIQPDVIADQKRYVNLNKEYTNLRSDSNTWPYLRTLKKLRK